MNKDIIIDYIKKPTTKITSITYSSKHEDLYELGKLDSLNIMCKIELVSPSYGYISSTDTEPPMGVYDKVKKRCQKTIGSVKIGRQYRILKNKGVIDDSTINYEEILESMHLDVGSIIRCNGFFVGFRSPEQPNIPYDVILFCWEDVPKRFPVEWVELVTTKKKPLKKEPLLPENLFDLLPTDISL